MAIELVTFGGLHILDDEGELDWLAGQRSRAALLVYLAVERRASREGLTTVFWPESDTENARHALRQALYHLRKAIDAEVVESRAHELVVTADVRIDAHDFEDLVARGELESAVRLYRGPFLDGVHLADLTSWESWVDNRRAHYARAFRKACRDLLESKRAAQDMSGAIDIAELWVARDQMDDEAQHRLIETLAAAGESVEALRQYETYVRTMEADGLSPSDATRELGERLRSEPSVLPVLKTASATSAESAPVSAVAPPWQLNARSVPRAAIAAIVLVALIGSAWGITRLRSEHVPAPSAIAVLPFSVHGGQSVAFLREGMVNLLTAAFDGAGSLRPVDSRATFAAAQDSETISNPDAIDRAVAQLGAGMYLLGDITEAAGRLQIDAAIYRRGVREPIARAVVNGESDSVFALADRLAARLLADLSDPAANRLLRTASVTTSSLPAFKEYLQGDRLMRAGEFERAADSYLAAIAHDPTFAVAYYRLGLAREWAPLPGEDSAANAAAHYAQRLSPRDRNLLEAFRAWRSGNAAEAERAYRAILARYPDDVDAWFQLGEIEFHHGPLLGHSISESAEAWRKVLAYEPRNLFAVTHLARLAVIDGRLASVDSLLAPYSPQQLRTDRRLIELALLRAVARGDTTTTGSLVRAVRMWEGLASWRVAVFLAAFSPQPGRMATVVHDLMDDSASPALRADVLWFASLLDLASGRLNASQSVLNDARTAERSTPAERRRSGFDPITEWFAATLPLPYPDSTLVRVLRRAASWQPSRNGNQYVGETGLGAPIQVEPLRQYTLGILSLRLRDTLSAALAAAKLQRLAVDSAATVLTRDVDRGLRARLAWQRGHPEDGLRLLQAMENNDIQGEIAATPFVSRANERFLRGELLAATGRNDEALRWFTSLGDGSVTEIPLRAPSHLRQAEIYEHFRKPVQAAEHYRRFVELWSNADPMFHSAVQSARQRLQDPDSRD